MLAPGLVILALALGPACRDATQVTLEIGLTNRASCAETNGTAVTVGTDPGQTEDRVREQFVTAATSSCSDATRQVGTLVVTPGANGRASVIVVVAYDKSIAPSSCVPPLYKGCIVARRQFTFTDYQQLHMPISIDPSCKDVPCDAFSTCRTGTCFKSSTTCDGNTCNEPGDPGDGGTDEAGAVTPDAGEGGAGQPDGGTDASSDASEDGSSGLDAADAADADTSPAGVFCDIGGILQCPSPTACTSPSSCCASGSSAACGVPSCSAGVKQYCCSTAGCPVGKTCRFSIAGVPLPGGATLPGTCD